MGTLHPDQRPLTTIVFDVLEARAAITGTPIQAQMVHLNTLSRRVRSQSSDEVLWNGLHNRSLRVGGDQAPPQLLATEEELMALLLQLD